MQSKIYRMRSCNSYSIEAFMKDQLWMSVPEKFNDPYDVSFYFNPDILMEFIKDNISDKVKEFFLSILVPETGYPIGTDLLDNILNFTTSTARMWMRRYYLVASFTTKFDEEIMWAHYSSNGTGFCLEYDYHEIDRIQKQYVEKFYSDMIELNKELNLKLRMPKSEYKKSLRQFKVRKVKYKDEKYDFTDALIEQLRFQFDIYENIENKKIEYESKVYQMMINKVNAEFEQKLSKDDIRYIEQNQKVFYYKNLKWKYESEYRFVIPNFDHNFKMGVNDYSMFSNVIPTAIYIGEFISESDRFTLVNLAIQKQIKVYELNTNYYSNPPKLERKELEINDILQVFSLDKYENSNCD